MALRWYCDACGEQIDYEPESFRVVVSTTEGPVTVLLNAGYGRPEQTPNFNPASSGAVVCKRCVYLALQGEFAMEDVQDGKDRSGSGPHHGGNGARR